MSLLLKLSALLLHSLSLPPNTSFKASVLPECNWAFKYKKILLFAKRCALFLLLGKQNVPSASALHH